MNLTTRRGLTLFQLLVVLAILLLLLALLLPAVAKVREAAARTQSQNNLKQLGLACHNYLAAHNVFPPGNDANNWSALSKLLPYIEQENVYKNLHDDLRGPVEKAKADNVNVLIRLFISPLDQRDRVTDRTAPTNYLLCAGSGPELKGNNGLFFQDSAVKIESITDGTSNTIMTAETLKGDGGTKAVDLKRQHIGLKKGDLKDFKADAGVTPWKDGKNVVGDRGANWADGRFLQTTYNAMLPINAKDPDVSCEGFGGASGPRTNVGGVNAGFADGSVRFVTEKVSMESWKGLSTRAGGEVVNDF